MRIEKYTTSSISNVDDEEFYFGSDNDFWFIYDETTDDALELWTSDSDGAGLDAELVSIPSGGTTITVNNDLVVGNDLNVQNDLDVDNDLNVDGNAVVDGTVNIAANGLLSGGGADGKMILSNLAADQGVLFDTTTNGQLTLTDESSAALDLNVTGDLTVGGDTKLTTVADGDLLIANNAGTQGVELCTSAVDNSLLFRTEALGNLNALGGFLGLYFGTAINNLVPRIVMASDHMDFYAVYGMRALIFYDMSTASRGIFEVGGSDATKELTASSGTQYGLCLGNASTPFAVNQSGTGGYHALHIDVTETATGSGDTHLINAGVGGSSKFSVDNSGVMKFLETTTPSATANYGAIYTKTDNKLYFQDGAGSEKEVTTTDTFHAMMYDEDNTDAFVVNDTALAHVYHTNGIASANLNGWTFDAGGAGTSIAVSSVADAGGGEITVTTGAAHGLAANDIISLTNMSDATYDGVYVVESIGDSTHFNVTVAYNADSTGTVDQAATLTASTGSAGTYLVNWTASATSAVNNETFDFCLYNNATIVTGSKIRRKFGTGGDFGAMAGAVILSISDADKLSFSLTNNDTAGNVTVRDLTVTLSRM